MGMPNEEVVWTIHNAKGEKTKNEFTDKCLDDISQNPDDLITKLESLQVQMDNIDISSKMTNCNVMIHMMNSLPEQYHSIVDNLEAQQKSCCVTMAFLILYLYYSRFFI